MDLVEVEYDELKKDGKGGVHRLANVYRPNPLYDPAERGKRLGELEALYGKKRFRKAAEVAALVYEDRSDEGIRALLELETQYGAGTIQQAADLVGRKSPSNPKRTMRYLLQTARGIGNKKILTNNPNGIE